MIRLSASALALVFLLPLSAPSVAHAQEPPSPSLFFTAKELTAIARANSGFLEKLPEVIEKKNTDDEDTNPQAPVDRGRRIITLSGIVYQGARDWTIWLNGERVTPLNIPDQVEALTVRPTEIELKWLDRAENRLVNLTLHPHQQYDLDQNFLSPEN